MPAAELKRRWREAATVYGAGIRLASTWTAEIFALSGLDFVWFDQQHGFISDEQLVPMLQAMNGTEATSLVRVPANDPTLIGRVLDAGSEGIIIPMVQTKEDAERALSACRFGPEGVRSNGTLRVQFLPGGIRRELICFVMIETELGVENAAEIASVPGVDGVFIGPSDLALSLGLPPAPGIHPGRHAEAVGKIRKACDDHGIVTMITGDAQEMKAEGFRAVSIGADNLFLAAALKEALARREVTGS